jgi:AcrR family transcriptional regulator
MSFVTLRQYCVTVHHVRDGAILRVGSLGTVDMPGKANSFPQADVRNPPLQARARERYDVILAAAQAEISDKGLDALTMYGIARRARITPTSIYRYFESVEQILIAVTSSVMADLEVQIDRLVESAQSADELTEAFGRGISESWNAFSRNPVARGLWSASKFLPQLRAIDDAFNRRVIDARCRRFEDLAPSADPTAFRCALTLLVGLSTPTFDLAMRQSRNARAALIEEFIVTATGRLQTVARPARARKPSSRSRM